MTTAIYDGYCVICKQTKTAVTALDWLHRVEFLDLHNWDEVNKLYPQLDYEQAMGQMHVLTDDGQLIGGFPAVRRLLRDLPLGYPIWLLLHLPGMNTLGNIVYRFVARNRYRINKLFGAPVCEDGTCKIHSG
jgi:predicted DCC family thiol-disulfide oxidoreductase YuxK